MFYPDGAADENDNRLATKLCTARPFYSDRTRNCYVLSPDEILEYIVAFVQEVNGIVQLNATITRMLLRHCKWNKHVMMEKLFEDADELYREARVVNPVNAIISKDNKECQICYEEMSPVSSAVSACGHRFCTACWSQYCKVKIMDLGVGTIACAANDCNVIIDDEKVMELVDDPHVKLRYQKLITNSFVERNELLRWCPGRGCSFAFRVDSAPSKPIYCRCECGTEICFECGEEYHAPITCNLLRKFKTAETLNRALPQPKRLEEKRCPNPRCKGQNTKNSGCHVMRCKFCDCMFCWYCLNLYKYEDNAYAHTCNGEQKPYKKKAKGAATVQTNQPEQAGLNDPVSSASKYKVARARRAQDKNLAKGDTKSSNVRVGAVRVGAVRVGAVPTNQPEQAAFNNPVASTYKRKVARVRGVQLVENPAESSSNVRIGIAPTNQQKQAAFNDAGPSTSKGNTNQINEPAQIAMGLYPHRKMLERKTSRRYKKYEEMVENDASAVEHFVVSGDILLKCKEQWREVLIDFELASLEWVRSCRTLKYFAVFDMYAVEVKESSLLNVGVNDLTEAVARLSESIELVDLEDESTYSTIPKVLSPAFEACQLIRSSLLKYVDEGFENELWIFAETRFL